MIQSNQHFSGKLHLGGEESLSILQVKDPKKCLQKTFPAATRIERVIVKSSSSTDIIDPLAVAANTVKLG